MSLITLISAGLKLVDQFWEMTTRSRGQASTRPSGRAEQVGAKFEISHGGNVTDRVEASDMRMDQWDEPRYIALRKRVQTNWDIYNDLFTSEAGSSAQEGARIRSDMKKTQESLCRDFREMVKLYERALGKSLPDHYQLLDACGPMTSPLLREG